MGQTRLGGDVGGSIQSACCCHIVLECKSQDAWALLRYMEEIVPFLRAYDAGQYGMSLQCIGSDVKLYIY